MLCFTIFDVAYQHGQAFNSVHSDIGGMGKFISGQPKKCCIDCLCRNIKLWG